jgi:hypothetical protein
MFIAASVKFQCVLFVEWLNDSQKAPLAIRVILRNPGERITIMGAVPRRFTQDEEYAIIQSLLQPRHLRARPRISATNQHISLHINEIRGFSGISTAI